MQLERAWLRIRHVLAFFLRALGMVSVGAQRGQKYLQDYSENGRKGNISFFICQKPFSPQKS